MFDIRTQNAIIIDYGKPIQTLLCLAKKYPDQILVWCHDSYKDIIDIEVIKSAFYIKNLMISYGYQNYFPDEIGYVEDSPFLKVNKKVKFPTWLMSSAVGAIYASQLIKFEGVIDQRDSLDYILNSIAKLGMPNGLFCYSDPSLLKRKSELKPLEKASYKELFKFVGQHYKKVWSFILFLDFAVYRRKILVAEFAKSYFKKRIIVETCNEFEPLKLDIINTKTTIDVIIPTIGRKIYLYDVLVDLSKQSILPQNVIIVEQNENSGSISELDYIETDKWPFNIIHKFIHRTGACNARNLALEDVTSNYVFLADDDIRLTKNIIRDGLVFMDQNKISALTFSCLRENETNKYPNIVQWATFGSGCSIIDYSKLNNVKFNMALEHGFGEDMDFGMQIRNQGIDVVYHPDIKLVHLKAPIGGFRSTFKHPWLLDAIQPKPSPTVMLHRIRNTTYCQLLGYKTMLKIKYYRVQHIKNPFKYSKVFNKQWKQSEFWANKLNELYN